MAIGQSRGRSPLKEKQQGKCREAGDIEDEGGIKGRTLMANDNNDGDILFRHRRMA